MPGIERFEVLVELKRTRPGVRVIVITGGMRGAAANHLQLALQLGADQVLAKPFSNDQLTAAINLLLPVTPAPAGETG